MTAMNARDGASRLHLAVARAAAALGGDPGDDAVGVHDVAGLAVDAVGGVDLQALGSWGRGCVGDHLVDGGGTEALAGVGVLGRAAGRADGGVGDVEVDGLVLLVGGAGEVEVGDAVEERVSVVYRPAGGGEL